MPDRARPARALTPGPGQESCWDYPRPPVCVPSDRLVTVRLGDHLIARSRRAIRVLETSHPPTWYVPAGDVDGAALRPSRAPSTICEFKGRAEYLDVSDGAGRLVRAGAWRYPAPREGFEAIAGCVAFAARDLECRVDGERVTPQEGRFYAGWITRDVVGPFKGGPGTLGW